MVTSEYLVLIVDDNAEDRSSLRRVLEGASGAHYRCLDAETAAAAIQLWRSTPPDVMLLDYQLPDDTGLSLLDALRVSDEPPSCAIIMLTGLGNAAVAVAALQHGAHDYLIKDQALGPQLIWRIERALERVQLERAFAAQRRELHAHAARLEVLAAAARIFAAAGTDLQTVLEEIGRTVVAAMGDGCVIHLLSADGNWLEPAAIYDMESEMGAFVGQVVGDRPLHIDDRAMATRILKSGQPLLAPVLAHDELRAVTKEVYWPVLERLRLHSFVGVPIAARGELIGVLLLYRRRAEQPAFVPEDLTLAEELADRAALAIVNARLFARAQKALRARDAVIATVSHDLRHPLTIIDGYAKLALRRLTRAVPAAPAAVADIITRIERTTTQMNSMLGELVDTARLEAGQTLQLALEPIELCALVRQVVAQYQATTNVHTLRVVTTLDTLHGMYDGPRLTRVLGNLVTNAIKYSPAGGAITVTLTTETVDAAECAVLSVQDQGIGIPERDLPTIFERFQRASNVGAIAGTGIGLSSSRQIVEQHGGHMHVRSVPGSGSIFTVILPLQASMPDA